MCIRDSLYMVQSFTIDQSKAATDFHKKMQDSYKDYNFPIAAAQAYDAAQLILQALKKVGPDREKIRDAIEGMKDFKGVTAKLDYVKDLGVNTIWLMPFYPSPLRDDGYDIADYLSIHPAYGTLEDFDRFIEEAHRRGLRVIADLVLNHTSDQHLSLIHI